MDKLSTQFDLKDFPESENLKKNLIRSKKFQCPKYPKHSTPI